MRNIYNISTTWYAGECVDGAMMILMLEKLPIKCNESTAYLTKIQIFFFTLSIPIARVIMVQFSTEYLRIKELLMTGSTMHSYILWIWREREKTDVLLHNKLWEKKHVIDFAIVHTHTPCPKKMMFAAKAAKYWFERFCQRYWPVCVTLSLILPKTLCHACFNAN